MAIPKFEDFLFPFLAQLKARDVLSKEMKDVWAQQFGFTEGGRLLCTKGGSVFQIDDRMGWGRQWLCRVLGVSTKKVYAIKKIDTDYFEE